MRVLVATSSFGEFDPGPLEELTSLGAELKRNTHGRTLGPEELVSLLSGCAGVVAGTEAYTRDVLGRLPELKVISRCGAGLDGIDLESAKERGISVLCTPFGPTRAVAELTVGMILSLIRHVGESDAELKVGGWKKRMGFLMEELKVGVMGLGRVGKCVAGLVRSWGAEVLGYDINPDRLWAEKNGVILRTRDELLKECDVLCVHLPYEARLRHAIGAGEFSSMKKGSFLVNTSRGGVLDEGALCDALRSGHIAGAALDVFEKEPYAGPLREFPNVILTPHIGSYARAGRIKMERECVENLVEELKNRGLLAGKKGP